MKIKHYLDGNFVSGIKRPNAFEATIYALEKDESKKRHVNLVMLEFNELSNKIPLLPEEARALAESLIQMANVSDQEFDE